MCTDVRSSASCQHATAGCALMLSHPWSHFRWCGRSHLRRCTCSAPLSLSFKHQCMSIHKTFPAFRRPRLHVCPHLCECCHAAAPSCPIAGHGGHGGGAGAQVSNSNPAGLPRGSVAGYGRGRARQGAPGVQVAAAGGEGKLGRSCRKASVQLGRSCGEAGAELGRSWEEQRLGARAAGRS